MTIPLDPAVVEILERHGLGELLPLFEAAMIPAVRLRTVAPPAEGVRVGGSKFGGRPDLPPDVPWPARGRTALPFVAQFDLREVARYDPLHRLLPHGLLSIFYLHVDDERNDLIDGVYPDALGGWQTIYTPPEQIAGLVPRDMPADLLQQEEERYAEAALELRLEPTFSINRDVSQELIEQFADQTKFLHFVECDQEIQALYGGGAGTYGAHRLFGYPMLIQDGYMKEEAHEVTQQLSWAAEDPDWRRRGIEDWTLLLQLDCDARPGFWWAGSGMVYFWITRQDLARWRFDRTWVIAKAT